MYWAGVRSEHKSSNLGVQCVTVGWNGQRGMKWESFVSKLQYLSLFNAAPNAVLVHLGGNDFEHSTICQISNIIKKGLSRLKSLFPGVKVVWVDILQRIKWRDNPDAMEHKRTRVNRCGRGLAHRKSGSVITLDIVMPCVTICLYCY